MIDIFIIKVFYTQVIILLSLCGVGFINNEIMNKYRNKIDEILMIIIAIGGFSAIGTFLYGFWIL